MSNPYLDRKLNKIGHVGRKSERKIAKKLGAKLTPNSGAVQSAKGDMHLGDFKIEAKSTQTGTLSLKRDWLLKISGEALADGKIPALSLAFTNAGGVSWPDGEWIAIPLSKFREFTGD